MHVCKIWDNDLTKQALMRKGTKYTVQALVKTLAWEVTPKQRSGFSGISQRMTLCMLSKSKTVGETYSSRMKWWLQWLPAKFKNGFSFGNVCWLRRGSHWMCGTTEPGVFLLGVNVKINVAICLEQGGSNNRGSYVKESLPRKDDWLGSFVNL